MRHILAMALCITLGLAARPAAAEDIGCVDTAFQWLGPNHAVCVSAFDDPEIPGVACHVSQARKGGISGALGLTEEASEFSIACRQVGPIDLAKVKNLAKPADVFSERTSIFFKKTRVKRMYDKTRNVLVYVAISTKLIDGSPSNSISSVPVMPWAGPAPQVPQPAGK